VTEDSTAGLKQLSHVAVCHKRVPCHDGDRTYMREYDHPHDEIQVLVVCNFGIHALSWVRVGEEKRTEKNRSLFHPAGSFF
jgi:hypothetical protein